MISASASFKSFMAPSAPGTKPSVRNKHVALTLPGSLQCDDVRCSVSHRRSSPAPLHTPPSMGDAARRRGGAADAEISMRPAMPPVSHLMTLYQRFDSLRNSIALLREQTLHTPGIEDWPSVQARFSNLLSHMYSVASALQSPSPHFFASQLATLHEFLNTEAQASNAFEEDNAQQSHSLLYLSLIHI